jgi:hypothetical protein
MAERYFNKIQMWNEIALEELQGVPKKTKTIEIINNNLIVRIWMP